MLEPAGNKLFNVEARAFVLEMRKAGLLVDLVPTDAATIMQRLKRGEFDFVPHDLAGRARRRTGRRCSVPTARSTTAATVPARSTRCSTKRAPPRGRARARRS